MFFAVRSAGYYLAAIFGPRHVFVDDVAAGSQIEIHDAVLFLHVGLVGLRGLLPPLLDCRQSDVVLLVALWASGKSDIPIAPSSDMAGGHAP